jgi:hypothetical protein
MSLWETITNSNAAGSRNSIFQRSRRQHDRERERSRHRRTREHVSRHTRPAKPTPVFRELDVIPCADEQVWVDPDLDSDSARTPEAILSVASEQVVDLTEVR